MQFTLMNNDGFCPRIHMDIHPYDVAIKYIADTNEHLNIHTHTFSYVNEKNYTKTGHYCVQDNSEHFALIIFDIRMFRDIFSRGFFLTA